MPPAVSDSFLLYGFSTDYYVQWMLGVFCQLNLRPFQKVSDPSSETHVLLYLFSYLRLVSKWKPNYLNTQQMEEMFT